MPLTQSGQVLRCDRGLALCGLETMPELSDRLRPKEFVFIIETTRSMTDQSSTSGLPAICALISKPVFFRSRVSAPLFEAGPSIRQFTLDQSLPRDAEGNTIAEN